MQIDWDSILAYNTLKVVRIRDKRLGILHLCFMLGILIYVVLYSAIYKKGYLITEEPVGSVSTSMWAPAEFKTGFPYCNDNDLPYPFEKLDCEYWDETNAAGSIGDDVGCTITTRVRFTDQYANCSFKNPKCRYEIINQTYIYLADIESYNVLIDHTMFAPSSQIQYNAQNLKGYILDSEGNEVQLNETDNTIGIDGKPDIVTVGKILEFGGINLDDPSSKNNSRSIRYDGIVAFVFITYSNTFSYNQNNFKYVYSIKKVENTTYDIPESIFLDNLSSRLFFKRHGLRLIFVQTGEIGRFNFQTLLLTLVSGLGLLTVTTVIVDQISLRILPQRKSYSSLKYQVSESMGRRKKIIKDDKGEELLYTNIEGL